MKYFLFIISLASLAACNLTRDVDIELPAYDRQPVVECYLEPGKPFRLLLTQSYSFFDPFGLDSSFLQKTLLEGADVTITYGGNTVQLANQLNFDLINRKIYNYNSTQLVPATPGLEFSLLIKLPNNGGEITGNAVMMKFVPIDSLIVEWKDSLARTLIYITEDQSTSDFYRRTLHYGSLDSLAEQDFITNDRTSTEPIAAFGMGFDLMRGDTVFNTVYHISKDYYDFYESIQLAIVGNLNPFAQPSPIKSNVQGNANPLGIFTSLVYDRDTTIIQ